MPVRLRRVCHWQFPGAPYDLDVRAARMQLAENMCTISVSVAFSRSKYTSDHSYQLPEPERVSHTTVKR